MVEYENSSTTHLIYFQWFAGIDLLATQLLGTNVN